ncbi:MAG TPA: hypothetical protein VKB70_02855 [Gaiellaceae bacterium]|nr:hypothetical protein [Gaiellaceae bacterium]
MASLIADARAARAEARRLRVEAMSLKLALRRSESCSLERRHKAEVALAQVRDCRALGLPSPWSTVRWLYEDEELEHTLVPLPSS